MKTLVDALASRQRDFRDAIDRLPDDSDEARGDIAMLREAVELVGCLRRLVADRTTDEVHKAFGAPGDFGYDTPIGDALAKVYRSR